MQSIVLPIADRHIPYARQVVEQLQASGVRGEVDDRTESISRKIRDAELRKIQYMAVVGDREQDAGEISLREHRKGDDGSFPVEAFIERLEEEVKARASR